MPQGHIAQMQQEVTEKAEPGLPDSNPLPFSPPSFCIRDHQVVQVGRKARTDFPIKELSLQNELKILRP